MSSSTSTQQQLHPASPAQLKYARALGLEVWAGQPAREVRKAITNEIHRRGRNVLRTIQPSTGDAFRHPRHGVVEVVTVHTKTLKVTLQKPDGWKFVTNAMMLGEYERYITDEQLAVYLNSLPSIVDWCRMNDVKPEPQHGHWLLAGWERARRAAQAASSAASLNGRRA